MECFYNLYPIKEVPVRLCVLTVSLETRGDGRTAAMFALAYLGRLVATLL